MQWCGRSSRGWKMVKLIFVTHVNECTSVNDCGWFSKLYELSVRTKPNRVFWMSPNVYLNIKIRYSLVRLVWQNTEEFISRPFAGLYKIRLLLRDRMRPKNLRNFLALVQLQLCLQLQQNTIGSVDVDVQICHFCVHKYLSGNKSLWTKVTNLTIHINRNDGVLLKL